MKLSSAFQGIFPTDRAIPEETDWLRNMQIKIE